MKYVLNICCVQFTVEATKKKKRGNLKNNTIINKHYFMLGTLLSNAFIHSFKPHIIFSGGCYCHHFMYVKPLGFREVK